MNNKLGENGIILSLLVLNTLSRFPILNGDLPEQKNWIAEIKKTPVEMSRLVPGKLNWEALRQ